MKIEYTSETIITDKNEIIETIKHWLQNPTDYTFDLNLTDGDCITFETDRKIYDICYDEIGFVLQIVVDRKILIIFQSIYTMNGYVEIDVNDIENIKVL